MKQTLLSLAFLCCLISLTHAKSITRDIKSFGAKGDGHANDQDAFVAAAKFFNARHGDGTLVISPGTYIVGRQIRNGGHPPNTNAYAATELLRFDSCRNLTVTGKGKAVIKYADSLRFGAFDAETGLPLNHPKGYYVNPKNAAHIGLCFRITACSNVTVSNLELDGNNIHIVVGGSYGDVGIQLWHYGVFVQNCTGITLQQLNIHNFGEDGIYVSNKPHPADKVSDNIKVIGCTCSYNCRQGMSWGAGNYLFVKDCTFANTGQVAFMSNPGAGFDIEAEGGPIANGTFQNCSFINNRGQGLVSDSGPVKDCSFTGCIFWGLDNWSIWVTKPGFTFTGCTIHGSIVHGWNSATDAEATKYINCHFEDVPYQGKTPYGAYLIECNFNRRETFTGCTFTANHKRLMWVDGKKDWTPDEKFQFTNCRFTINTDSLPPHSRIATQHGIRQKGSTYTFTAPDAKEKAYYIDTCCNYNTDLGNNKIIYAAAK